MYKNYNDLSDELRRWAPQLPTAPAGYAASVGPSGMVALESSIVTAMQEAFTLGKGYGFREGNQVGPRVDAATIEEIRTKAGEQIAAAGEEYERRLKRERSAADALRAKIDELEMALSDAHHDMLVNDHAYQDIEELLATLTQAVVNEYLRDPSAPSVLFSWLAKDRCWYVSIVRYSERYGQGKSVVCNVKASTLREALEQLGKAWLGDPEPKRRLGVLLRSESYESDS